eukprot:gene24422-31801_t
MALSTNSYEEQERSSSWFAHGKVISMLFFVFTDLALNSTLDYDTYNNNLTKNIILGLFGLQVIIEISIFLVLFLATADTFLFRVGLLGVLMRTFRLVLIIHPIYFVLTLVTGAYRVRILNNEHLMSELWESGQFISLSYLQKLEYYSTVAVPYYVLNIRAAFKLEDPIFFNKNAWIALVNQYYNYFDVSSSATAIPVILGSALRSRIQRPSRNPTSQPSY